eukprot:COSAG01_NODE_50508_length_362_cov_354.300380_1_plen_103_part_01
MQGHREKSKKVLPPSTANETGPAPPAGGYGSSAMAIAGGAWRTASCATPPPKRTAASSCAPPLRRTRARCRHGSSGIYLGRAVVEGLGHLPSRSVPVRSVQLS